jgi:predicted acetyltransferase
MKSIRKLSSEMDFTMFTDIVGNAYPGFSIETEEQKRRFFENSMKVQKENPFVTFYGVFEEDRMLGGMRFHDFKMNLLSTKINVGGIGLIAVDLLYKKEKVAKTIVTNFIEHYKNLGVSMVMLYPFRPDFYKKMGFGFGTSMNQYRVKPSHLPKGNSKSNIRYTTEDDAGKLLDCYNRIYEKTNGLIEKHEREFAALFSNPKSKVVAYYKDNEIKGYMIYEFKLSEKTFINDIVVNQLLFENTESLMELMTFLNSQSDQIRHIIFNIQDEDFRFLLENPANDSDNIFTPVYHECSIQGTGLMYRVINIRGIINELAGHNFNNENCRLKITANDNFIIDNDGSIIVEFINGFASISTSEEYNVEISLDIADFSSLITCSVTFNSLYKYGRASISDENYLKRVNNIFASVEKPICLTIF